MSTSQHIVLFRVGNNLNTQGVIIYFKAKKEMVGYLFTRYIERVTFEEHIT
jgi:hypothetical protein